MRGSTVLTLQKGLESTGGAELRVEDTVIETCGAVVGVTCSGIVGSGITTVDNTRIHVGPGSLGFARGLHFQEVGSATISDSVVVVDGGAAAISYGSWANVSADQTIVNTLIEVRSGASSSGAIYTNGLPVTLVNSVITPPTGAGTWGIYLGGASTLTARGNRFTRATGGTDLRNTASPGYSGAWSAIAAGCGGLGAWCAEAGGNSVGAAGFHDAANGDYRLVDGAACVDHGIDTTAWLDDAARVTDLLGVVRDATPDCGPTEWRAGQF